MIVKIKSSDQNPNKIKIDKSSHKSTLILDIGYVKIKNRESSTSYYQQKEAMKITLVATNKSKDKLKQYKDF